MDKMETKQTVVSDTALFLEALSAIPNDEKDAYLTALAKTPRLVQSESCISRFIRYTRHDTSSAAALFVDYWQKRQSIFGKDRAFLPMALSEGGAMNESCNALLRAGWIIPLPPDDTGRRVCFLDMTIEETRFQHCLEDRLCCLFFVLQVLSEDFSAQNPGIILIVLYDDTCYAPKDAIEGFEDILRAMPVQVSKLHLIPSLTTGRLNAFFDDIVPRALKTLLSCPDSDQPDALESSHSIHADESQDQMLKKLADAGLSRENLPVAFGGMWSQAHHNAWIKIRLDNEERDSKMKTAGLFCNQIQFPGNGHTTGLSLSADERRRRREAKHSRQKRDRKRCRTKALLLLVQHLKRKNQRARDIGKTLSRALDDAKRAVREGKMVVHDASRLPVGYSFQYGPVSYPPVAPTAAPTKTFAAQSHNVFPSSLAFAPRPPVSIIVIPPPSHAMAMAPQVGRQLLVTQPGHNLIFHSNPQQQLTSHSLQYEVQGTSLQREIMNMQGGPASQQVLQLAPPNPHFHSAWFGNNLYR